MQYHGDSEKIMRILEKIEILRGESSPTIRLGVSGVMSLDGYTCEMKITSDSGNVIVAKREVAEKITEGKIEHFALRIRASDTRVLESERLYIWSIEISNDLVFYKEETRIGIYIREKD